MKIYIDTEYKCHISPGEDFREIDEPKFDGCCTEYIEGMRLVPEGETWTREDGEVFIGKMTAPWKPYDPLYKAQLEYEIEQYKAALTEIETALEVTSE